MHHTYDYDCYFWNYKEVPTTYFMFLVTHKDFHSNGLFFYYINAIHYLKSYFLILFSIYPLQYHICEGNFVTYKNLISTSYAYVTI